MGTTITDLDIELKMKISRISYLESRLFQFYYILMVASISECLKSDLEDIRDHIACKQADVVCRRKGDDREKMLVLSVLSQINNVIERFYSNDFNDTEE